MLIGKGRIKKMANKAWKPNRWIAAILGLFLGPIGLLYVGQWQLALIYLTFGFGLFGTLFTISLPPLIYGLISLFWLILPIAICIFTFIKAHRVAPTYSRPWSTKPRSIIVMILVLFTGVALFRAFAIEPFKAPSQSMSPTLPKGSTILVKKWGYGNYKTYGIPLYKTKASVSIKRGDIMVFEFPHDPKTTYVKRVVGLPGDKVSYKSKKLFINNKSLTTHEIEKFTQKVHRASVNFRKLKEQYKDQSWEILTSDKFDPNFKYQEVTIPKGHYYVLGDNRDFSADSRMWGLVSSENMIGKVTHSKDLGNLF